MNIEENGVSRKMTMDDIPKLDDALRSRNWYGFRRWINVITSDEGCTSADARKLREYNHGLSDENERLRDALRRISERAKQGVEARNLGDMADSHLRLPNEPIRHAASDSKPL